MVKRSDCILVYPNHITYLTNLSLWISCESVRTLPALRQNGCDKVIQSNSLVGDMGDGFDGLITTSTCVTMNHKQV